MSENTKIEWADHTWNPWQGCRPVSAGCQNCYMYREKNLHKQNPSIVVRSKSVFNLPLKSKAIKPGDKIFTCSWSDFFIEGADPWRDETWDIIRRTPQYIYLILTKRLENVLDRLPDDFKSMLDHVWLGFTAENQQTFNERSVWVREIKEQYPQLTIFWSYEPALGSVDARDLMADCGCVVCQRKYYSKLDDLIYPENDNTKCPECGGEIVSFSGYTQTPLINWVICGGESGPKARPMHPDWVRGLRDQCVSAGVPFFFKQWGEWGPFRDNGPLPENCRYIGLDGKIRIGDAQEDTDACMGRVGKKAAGRMLDGREWNEMPEVIVG